MQWDSDIKQNSVRTCSPVFYQNWICSTGLLVKFFMSLHKMVYSAHAWFTPEYYISLFCCTFSKHICPSCKVQSQINKMPLAIYIDFPKFSFNFTLRRKHLLNLSLAILRSDWVQSGLSASLIRNKVLESKSSKSNHDTKILLRYLKGDDVLGVGKKVAKRRQKCGKKGCKKVAKGWQKLDKVAMIINLATDESWLATNNMINHQIFFFLAKYN